MFIDEYGGKSFIYEFQSDQFALFYRPWVCAIRDYEHYCWVVDHVNQLYTAKSPPPWVGYPNVRVP